MTRLETRTKEFNSDASRNHHVSDYGEMKVNEF